MRGGGRYVGLDEGRLVEGRILRMMRRYQGEGDVGTERKSGWVLRR